MSHFLDFYSKYLPKKLKDQKEYLKEKIDIKSKFRSLELGRKFAGISLLIYRNSKKYVKNHKNNLKIYFK